MNKLFFTLAVFLFCHNLFAQSLDIDIRRDWYAEVPTIDMSEMDTLTLYPLRGNLDQTKQIFIWHYKGDNIYELQMYNNQQAGIDRPYYFAPEKWKYKENEDGTLSLTIRDHRDPQPFHKTFATYTLIPYRDNYNILYKMVLVKKYNNRYMQRLKAPISPH